LAIGAKTSKNKVKDVMILDICFANCVLHTGAATEGRVAEFHGV
jgi:hypothetical protein